MASVTLSPLFRDLFAQSIAPFVALTFVGHIDTRTSLASRLEALAPDLVLFGLSPGESVAAAIGVADQLPQPVVVAISGDLREALVLRGTMPPVTLHDASAGGIADAITMFRR